MSKALKPRLRVWQIEWAMLREWMRISALGLVVLCLVLPLESLGAAEAQNSAGSDVQKTAPDLTKLCLEHMNKLPGKFIKADIEAACQKVSQLEGCTSSEGVPIYHYEKIGTAKNPRRIFAKSLIHGDELTSGVVARSWIARLEKIDPRNTWRVIPVTSPDGWKRKTRTNANKVDLNRNFPTQDWQNDALAYWKTKSKSDPRRYPGPSAASESETKCLLKHFEEFKPDLIISVHTPLGLLDLDGPKVKNPPAFKPLPWHSLGNFPGSLGRYMWVDKKVPVLTIELKGNHDIEKLESFDQLQDISGTIAIQADQLRKQ